MNGKWNEMKGREEEQSEGGEEMVCESESAWGSVVVWLCVLKLSVGCASVTASVCDCESVPQSPCDMSSSLGLDNDSTENLGSQ